MARKLVENYIRVLLGQKKSNLIYFQIPEMEVSTYTLYVKIINLSVPKDHPVYTQ